MFDNFFQQNKLPAFRIRQLWKQYYGQAAGSIAKLTNWPQDLRDQLAESGPFLALRLQKEFISTNGQTTKVLFQRNNAEQLLESVLLRHKDGRNTVCISCMIGCPVGCVFCATGKLGFIANLTADEIVEQVLYFQRKLSAVNSKVTNIVFMGMGEPLLNLDEVLKAIAIFTDPEKLALSDRRISISTSGYISQLSKLMQADFKGKLAISLHAADQKLRAELMPVARNNPLPELMQAIDRYTAQTNKRVFYEYLLIKGVNDSPRQAEDLVGLLKGRLAHVNLIPFNTVSGSSWQRSGKGDVETFLKILTEQGISATVRASMGADIAGACGQLAGKQQ